MDPSDTAALYPSIPARIKAGEIDALLLAATAAALLGVYTLTDDKTPQIIFLMVAVVVLYEPLCVSCRGATVGHRMMGFKIIDTATKRTLSFPRSFARFCLKTVLGLFSILGAYFDKREQFLHDRIIGSQAVLVNVSLERLNAGEERLLVGKETVAHFAMPSLARRIVFIVLYIFVGFIVASLIVFTMFPECEDKACPFDEIYNIILCAILVAAIVAGLKGKLPGARKRPIAPGWKLNST